MISLGKLLSVKVARPLANRLVLFADKDTGLLSYKDSAGIVHSLGGAELPYVTVGVGQEYATPALAFAAGKWNILIVGDVTLDANIRFDKSDTPDITIKGLGRGSSNLNMAGFDIGAGATAGVNIGAGTFTRVNNVFTFTGAVDLTTIINVGDWITVTNAAWVQIAFLVRSVTATTITVDGSPSLGSVAATANNTQVSYAPVQNIAVSEMTLTKTGGGGSFFYNDMASTAPKFTFINLVCVGDAHIFNDGVGLPVYARDCDLSGNRYSYLPSLSFFVGCLMGSLYGDIGYGAGTTCINCDFEVSSGKKVLNGNPSTTFIACNFGNDVSAEYRTASTDELRPTLVNCNDVNGSIVILPIAYAVATLPDATVRTGVQLWTSNGIAGAAGLVVSNGTNWVHVKDGITVAAIV